MQEIADFTNSRMLKCEMPQGVDDDRADGGEDSKGILCVRVRVREKKKKDTD